MKDNTLKLIKVGDPMIIMSTDGKRKTLTIPDGRQAKWAVEPDDTHYYIAIPRADWVVVFGGEK